MPLDIFLSSSLTTVLNDELHTLQALIMTVEITEIR
jgi:hypothetical protein